MIELETLLSITRQAGNILKDFQAKGYNTTFKSKDNPLTEVDLAVSQFLKTELLKATPSFGWLDEETLDDKSRLEKEFVWIVDPIDGTREFIENCPEYGISIALVKNHQPIMATVFNTGTGELFHAIKGQGAFLNNQKILVRKQIDAQPTILVSRSEFEYKKSWDNIEIVANLQPCGSAAYKLAKIAKGDADASITFHNCSEWDVAAGVLLVQEAGGSVVDRNFQPLTFNQDNVRLQGINAFTPNTEDFIKDFLISNK